MKLYKIVKVLPERDVKLKNGEMTKSKKIFIEEVDKDVTYPNQYLAELFGEMNSKFHYHEGDTCELGLGFE